MKSTILSFSLIIVAVFAFPGSQDVQYSSIQNQIAGGDPAILGQFPFQVGVQTHYLTRDNEEYTTWCGGSLISDQVVLTAAHCAYRGISTEIFLGAVDLANGPLIINVPKEGIIVHEEYGKTFGMYDVAVVLLPQKVSLNDRIQAVNLPRVSQRGMSFEKQVGWISGWGRLGDGEGKGSTEKLQYARRWILPDDYCQYEYSAWYDKATQICVDGSHGISACKGDSGGPLTIEEDDGTRTLVGLASYEKMNGCEKGFPVVYQRVTAFLDWISEKSGITIRE